MVWENSLRMPLSHNDRDNLLKLSRKTLEAAFAIDPDLPLKTFRLRAEWLTEAVCEFRACFVSLFITGERLRGCIGTLAHSNPLFENVFEYTRQAAFHDPRFPPLTQSEISDVTIHLSILGDTHRLTALGDLKLGLHGLLVSHQGHRGVLLAKVALQFGWDRNEFLRQTCQKAGLNPSRASSYTIEYFEEEDCEETRTL